MKRVNIIFVALLISIAGFAQEVKVEFFTPSIVHIVKGQPTKTLVITAKPEQVDVTHKGNTWQSSDLIVKQDASGNLTFLTSKGKVLLREDGWSLIRKTIDEWQVSQTFILDKDEAIYGLGTIQNGKMNRRGEKKRMEQSNLEDFQNVLQSIKGWGIYWENYSPTLLRIMPTECRSPLRQARVSTTIYVWWLCRRCDSPDASSLWRCADVPTLDLRLLAVEGTL